MVTLTANVAGEDLGRALTRVNTAIQRAGAPPRGATVAIRGQLAAMKETFTNITAGLIVAVVVIFLLLAANFQSLRLAFVVVSTVPAVLAGVAAVLWLTGTTLNVQSFMGAIGGERHPARDVCRALASAGRVSAADGCRRGARPYAARSDDERRHDCRNDPDGARVRGRR